MKKLTYIIALFFSLLIIYSGAGVAIAHYCCAHCEEMQDNCCTSVCTHVEETHSCASDQFAHAGTQASESNCTATIYKLNLMQHAVECLSATPAVITLFDTCVSCLLLSEDAGRLLYSTHHAPPPLHSVRQKLAFYSVFII